jgi:ORF6N domain
MVAPEMGDSNFFRYFRGLTCTSKTMAKKSEHALIPLEVIAGKIFTLRGHRVMLDRDLAELYGVKTKALNQAVKRNQDRFPDDFMFRLTSEEAKAVRALRSQIVTLKRGQHIKYLPYVFTEHGVVMLANVLISAVAVRASIQVVRAFVHLRRLLATNEEFARKIEALEKKVGKHDADLQAILAMLRKILEPPPTPPRRPFGFFSPSKK